MSSLSPIIKVLSALAAILMFVLAAIVESKWAVIVLAGVGGVGVAAVLGSMIVTKSETPAE
jgi:uncharacterized membrane protein